MSSSSPSSLPQPIESDPSRLIENVYPLGVGNQPDIDSRDIGEDYLWRRYHEIPLESRAPHLVMIPEEVEQTRVGMHLVWPSDREPRRFWRWLRFNLTGLAVVNAVANVDQLPSLGRDGIESLQVAQDNVADWLGLGRRTVTKTRLVEKEVSRTEPSQGSKEQFFSQSEVGRAEIDSATLDRFFTEVADLQAEDVKIDSVQLLGKASDEWRSKPDSGLERPDSENSELAAARGESLRRAIVAQAAARGVSLPEIETISSSAGIQNGEAVLSKQERSALDAASRQFGYADVMVALRAFDNDPGSLPPTLHELLKIRFGDHRGVSLIINFTTPERVITAIVPQVEHYNVEEPDGDPNNDNRDYDWDPLPFFVPPIPGLHRRPGTRTKLTPFIIPGEEGEDEWLRIYEEAVVDDDTLRSDAWAYTRKYQALLREGRINHIYQMHYQDADGHQQILRVLFVDHTPTAQTVTGLVNMLQSFSQMNGGAIGNNLDAIAVFPEENAGIRGNTPKQVGLGIDYQSPFQVVGTAYYSLGLVEMHMPTDLSAEELAEFEGPIWTFAHELGHLIDHTNEPARLIAIRGLSRRYHATLQRAGLAEEIYDQLEQGLPPRLRWWERLLGRRPDTSRRWLVRRGLETVQSDVVRLEGEVADDDPRLREAIFIRLQNRFPTLYSGRNDGELWGDSTAQAATGIGIPRSQQPDLLNPPTDPRFAREYAIASRLFELISNHIGSDPNADTIVWPNQAEAERTWQHEMGNLESDPHVARLATEARQWDFRETFDPRILHILVRARRNQN